MLPFVVQVRNTRTNKLVYSKAFEYRGTARAAAEDCQELADSYRVEGRGEYRISIAIQLD